MNLAAYIQNHVNDDMHTAVLYDGSSFFIGGGFKQCRKCFVTKPRVQFAENKRRLDGRQSFCKDCHHLYYMKHRERNLELQRVHYTKPGIAEKKQKQKVQYRARRFFFVRALGLKGSATYRDLASLWKKQRGTCALTGIRLTRENSQLDHIVPRAKSGSDEIDNLRWLQRDVNLAKRDLSDAEFIELCRLVITRHQNKTKEG